MKKTQDEIARMTFEEAETELTNAVYSAALFLERLENAGLIRGNGHHAAQAVAHFATDELRRRWVGPLPSREEAS